MVIGTIHGMVMNMVANIMFIKFFWCLGGIWAITYIIYIQTILGGKKFYGFSMLCFCYVSAYTETKLLCCFCTDIYATVKF